MNECITMDNENTVQIIIENEDEMMTSRQPFWVKFYTRF